MQERVWRFWWAVSHEGVKQWCQERFRTADARSFLAWVVGTVED